MPIPLLAVAATALATAIAVAGRTRGPPWLHLAFKPLIVPPLFAAAALLPSRLPQGAQGWLLAALALCWLGDVALMHPRGFVAGLAAFLLAHVAFLVCFGSELPWRAHQLPWLLAVLPLAYLGLRRVLSRTGKLLPAVLVYAAALCGVAWRLLARVELLPQVGSLSAALGATGGLLFILGDALLARRRFAQLPAPYWMELGVYSAAVTCMTAATW